MKPEFAVKMQNVAINKDGNIAKRNGFTKHISTAITGSPNVLSLHEYIKNDGTPEILFTTSDGKIYRMETSSYTELGTGFTASLRWYSVYFNQRRVFFNGTDAPQVYDGTSLAALGGTPPVSKFAEVASGRIFTVGIADNKLRIHACALGDATNWTVP